MSYYSTTMSYYSTTELAIILLLFGCLCLVYWILLIKFKNSEIETFKAIIRQSKVWDEQHTMADCKKFMEGKE